MRPSGSIPGTRTPGWTAAKPGYAARSTTRRIADFDEAIRLDPHLASAHARRGRMWFERKDYDKAIADLDEAIRLDPRASDAFADRGAVRGARGQLDQALADLDEAIRLDPQNEAAYADRAHVWFERRRSIRPWPTSTRSSAAIPGPRSPWSLARPSDPARRNMTGRSPISTRRSGSSPGMRRRTRPSPGSGRPARTRDIATASRPSNRPPAPAS